MPTPHYTLLIEVQFQTVALIVKLRTLHCYAIAMSTIEEKNDLKLPLNFSRNKKIKHIVKEQTVAQIGEDTNINSCFLDQCKW